MYPRTPDGWTAIERAKVGPFTTSVTYRRPDGSLSHWRSRVHRKHASALSRTRAKPARHWWFAPDRASWWIGVLFALGSTCFLIAPFPGFLQLVGSGADGIVFFVGSIFFTAAASLQHIEAINADRGPADAEEEGTGLRVLTIEPGRIDWWATLIQLVGTVFFNLSTWDAMQSGLSTQQENRLIWGPDVLGSACFLIASYLAFAESCEAWGRWKPGDREWRIGALNMAGSIAFGISAIAAFVVPSTGTVLNLAWVNGFTALGALGFLLGALLLLPEAAEGDAEASAAAG